MTSHSGHNSSATVLGTSTCTMDMLLNWQTVDACFFADSWQVTNNASFAASCIGTALLVVVLEFLRRVGSEYDSYLLRQFRRRLRFQQTLLAAAGPADCSEDAPARPGEQIATFRATALQQLGRAILHGLVIGIAYLLMLIVMSFNGYILISVILGAVLGKFLCDWMVVRLPLSPVYQDEKPSGASSDSATTAACCYT